MNAVILAVLVMVALSLLRVSVVFALVVGALVGGLVGGLSLDDTLSAFNEGTRSPKSGAVWASAAALICELGCFETCHYDKLPGIPV